MALNKGKLTHIEVPSSNEPLPSEWGKPMWYTIRLTALQAREDLSDVDAQRIVNFFDGLHITIPCPECRGHYATYWSKTPYTFAHAKNTEQSMFWVEELRKDVDSRIAAEKKAEATKSNSFVPYKADGHAVTRKFAIKSAVHYSILNHTGRKAGCNCGSNRKRRS